MISQPRIPAALMRPPKKGDHTTYVLGFHCNDGIVLSADTLETVDDQKQYCEKLAVSLDRSYPLAIGGAGVDEIIEAFNQELTERISKSRPATIEKLTATIRKAINKVFSSDMPVAVLDSQARTLEMIVAAKPPKDTFALFRIKGKRVYLESQSVIIGYNTPHNKMLMTRLYKDKMPMSQAVVMAAYLVAQSKGIDVPVGGETRVAVITAHGASLEDNEYVSKLEARTKEFIQKTDSLFLSCADVASQDSIFQEMLAGFNRAVEVLRSYHTLDTAKFMFDKLVDPNWHGDPYAKLPVGSKLMVPTATIEFDGTPPKKKPRDKILKGESPFAIEVNRRPPDLPDKKG